MPDTPFLTARNPFALAEIVLGRPIDWCQVLDRRAYLEEILQTPYEQLFDPRYDSPVYLGSGLDERGRAVPREPDFGTEDDPARSDADRYPDIDLSHVHRLADLKALIGAAVEDAPVRQLTPSRAGGWTVEFGQPAAARRTALSRIFDRGARQRLWDKGIVDQGWTPDGAEWTDTGTFFREAAEYFDPVQGSLGDCWLIAAMSSVAWSQPYSIAERSRATGTGNDQATNLFEFVDPDTGDRHRYEASDHTLVWAGTTAPLYGRSSEPGEIWPALVEKAYAMWRAGTSHDRPNLTVLNGGDPVHASAALMGRRPHYTWTQNTSGANLIGLVKSHSDFYRTRNPMTAWTYSTSAASPDGVDYADANIAANHAYSVLGWTTGSRIVRSTPYRPDLLAMRSIRPDTEVDYRWTLDWHRLLQQDYIVLRNPWGFFEATAGTMSGVISMRDVSFWRSLDLGNIDGVFAIDVPSFKKYFAGIGVAL